jgi:hypothetical protein
MAFLHGRCVANGTRELEGELANLGKRRINPPHFIITCARRSLQRDAMRDDSIAANGDFTRLCKPAVDD